MPLVTFLPSRRIIRVAEGTTLLDAYRQAELPAFAGCAGLGTCGKCRLRFPQGAPSPGPTESTLLPLSQIEVGYRLACLSRVSRDTIVEVTFADVGPGFKELGAFAGIGLKLQPVVRRVSAHGLLPPSPGMPATLGDGFEAILFGDELLSLRPADRRPVMGLGFDIGTTSLAAYLVDLETGAQKAALGLRNAQAAYGADVISRIAFANTHDDGLCKLQSQCLAGLNRLITQLVRQAHCSAEDIYHIVVVGNPTMLHLFLGIAPRQIGTPPFEPVFKEGRTVSAEALSVQAAPGARVETLPIVSGYVGADTVAMALLLGLDRLEESCLAIDVGTNGEILLSHAGRVYACSTAAGPAFEGARISCGMRAQPGAIGYFSYDKGTQALRYHMLGGRKPRGISGTGLVSLVALLLREGIISPPGRFCADGPVSGCLRGRLRQGEKQQEFLIVADDDVVRGGDIVLTQRDVRELQLAKGAMAAGIQRLLEHAGLRPGDLDHIYLGGAFGSSLEPWAAQCIGLLPPVDQKRVTVVGNAAGAGAKMVLCSQEMRQRATLIAQSIVYLELSLDQRFNDLFIEALEFPQGEGRVPPFDRRKKGSE
ncbi:MAG: ASKHA domain-containing protein [Candidatus Binatia bacterium]